MITARTVVTKSGANAAELLEHVGSSPRVIARVYASKDGTRLRIVLPELAGFAQTRIRPDEHVIDFERDAVAAQRGVRR